MNPPIKVLSGEQFFVQGSCELNQVGKYVLACIRERAQYGGHELFEIFEDRKNLLDLFDALMKIAEEQRKSLALVAERSELKGGT